MVSNPDAQRVSPLLLTIVFQLGICILLLSEIADAVRGYDTLVGLAGRLVAFAVLVGVLWTALVEHRTRTG